MTVHGNNRSLSHLLNNKSEHTLQLFNYFIQQFEKAGRLTIEPTKTMIGISNSNKRIAWITQLGKNFIHVVFPFKQVYKDNLCFQKTAQVPGQNQYNHHLRIYLKDDINAEVIKFMKMAYKEEK
ncbi:MAG: DUF5655 domain-containing protein [Bacteroidota bacterium]|nr:DUF5655 domain-containing protein [Bacteroidota bacterium]